MKDYSSLITKVNDLKAKIEQDSITPIYLGSLLDDFIAMMKAIDMTDLHEDIVATISRSISALSMAREALAKSTDNENSIEDNLLLIRNLQVRTGDLEETLKTLKNIVGILQIAADDSVRHLRPDVHQMDDYVTIGTYGAGPKDDIEWTPVDILPATHERAGVMTARDKRRLDAMVSDPDSVKALTVEEIIEIMKY